MELKRGGYSLLFRYISREFLISFSVAFVFFFLIFFVNSILLLVQRILLKNITFLTMLEMVALSMPQFLIYTIPFATLSGASMVLGDMNSNNELLAFRSSGVPLASIFRPIIIWAVVLSFCTFFVADVLHPWSNKIYRERLTVLMRDMPTFELESNSINTVGNILLSNGIVEGSSIDDVVLMNTDRTEEDKTITSPHGNLELIDSVSFVYRLDLSSPSLLMTDSTNPAKFLSAEGESASFFLDFSDQVPSLTSTSPTNLSSRELLSSIRERNEIQEKDRLEFHTRREDQGLRIASAARLSGWDGKDTSGEVAGASEELMSMTTPPTNFYGQYYKAELMKKFSLSSACFFLSLVALPLGLMRLKYGKLAGFAISLLIAVSFWYMLFFAQLAIFDITSSPYLLIFSPNLVIGFLAFILYLLMRKAR